LNLLQKIASYCLPIRLKKIPSEINGSLEITLSNGTLVLDTKNTNYSFGSLQRILKKGLLHIGKPSIEQMDSILVLGLGAGSVVETLLNDFQYQKTIVGVEKDEKVIEIGKKYFGLTAYANLHVLHYDAFEFVLRTKKVFDLIVIDIFQDKNMPNFLFENHFQFRLLQLLPKNGKILFNTFVLGKEDQKRNELYVEYFTNNHCLVEKISKVEGFNEILLVTKK